MLIVAFILLSVLIKQLKAFIRLYEVTPLYLSTNKVIFIVMVITLGMAGLLSLIALIKFIWLKWSLRPVNTDAIVNKLIAVYHAQSDSPKNLRVLTEEGQVKVLSEAIQALNQAKEQGQLPGKQVNRVLKQLTQGRLETVKTLFTEILKDKVAQSRAANQEAAIAARHLSAFNFLDNAKEALITYRQAVELDPDNPEGWNQLGYFLSRIGELTQARTAYEKVLRWGESHENNEYRAVAYSNLGILYWMQGDLLRAEKMYRLGSFYQSMNHLQQAEQMFRKILEIDETMNNKEGMASDYGNLGILYHTQGDLKAAQTMYLKSIALFKELNSPNALKIQQWLNELNLS